MRISTTIHMRATTKCVAQAGDKYDWVNVGDGGPFDLTIFGKPESLEALATALNQCAQMQREREALPADSPAQRDELEAKVS